MLALRFRDELKHAEIAEQIGVSQMQISRILSRITDQLRQEILLESGIAGQTPDPDQSG